VTCRKKVVLVTMLVLMILMWVKVAVHYRQWGRHQRQHLLYQHHHKPRVPLAEGK
jgi:hypothetical protein